MAVIYSFNSFIAPRNAKTKILHYGMCLQITIHRIFIASEVLCLFIVGVNNETIYENIK